MPGKAGNWLSRLGIGFLVVFGVVGPARAQTAPERSLALDVFRGDGAVHDVRAASESDVVVRVTDEAEQPVQGAAVVFQLPAGGPGARFLDSGRFATVISDEDGIAKAAGLKPNDELGEFTVTVTASFRDFGSATLSISQRNTDSLAPPTKKAEKKSGSNKTLVILAVAGGAIAGAVLGLSGGGGGGGGGSTPTTPPPTPSATLISAGPPSFGAPR